LLGQWSGSCTDPFSRFCHYSCSAAAPLTAPAFHCCCHQRRSACSPWSASSLVSRTWATATTRRSSARRLYGQGSGGWSPCPAGGGSDSLGSWLCCTMRPGSRSSRRQARSRAVWSAWCKYRRRSLCGRRSTWLGKRMRAGPDARQAIVGAMVGLLYGSVLAFLSLGAIGGGHGSIVPLLLSSAPLGVLLLVGNLVGASHVGEAILFAMLYGYTADMDGARVGGCAVRRWDEPQTHSGSGSVAVRVGPRARRDDDRLAYRFSCRSVESAAVGRYVGDGLPGWAGGVVVANKKVQSTSTARLTTTCGRNSRSRHRNDLRGQTALPKQTQQNR
jgi:hypothetical protein